MKLRWLVVMSITLLVLTLASVSASEVDHTISDSSLDNSIIADNHANGLSFDDSVIADDPVSDSSSDDSLIVDDDVPELPSDDSIIDDDKGIPIVPDDGAPVDADDEPINSDINDDSIIINITNDTRPSNIDDRPISNIKEEAGSFDALQSIVDLAPSGTTIYLYRDYKGAEDKQITINKNLVIDGQGHTIDCVKKCRAIYSSKGTCTIRNLKFVNGFIDGFWPFNDYCGGAVCLMDSAKFTFENCVFENNWADDRGGAIYNDNCLLTIRNCTFKNNSADDISGGAIFSGAPIIVENSLFANNRASNVGGAIQVDSEELSKIINSQFKSNSAGSEAGALFLTNGLYVYNCTFSNNKAANRGGAIVVLGEATIEKSLFESNEVKCTTTDDVVGGAIYSYFKDLHINNCTFKNNFADDYGGAIYCGQNLYINYDQGNNEDYNTFFSGNTADSWNGGAIYGHSKLFIKNAKFSSNEAWLNGGAIHSFEDISVTHCLFDSNRCEGAASKCKGGAIFGNRTVNILKSIFNNNYAENYGGAVFSERTVCVDASTFDSNSAKYHGGAIYAKDVDVNSNLYGYSYFKKNKAVNDNGGAIYASSSVYAMDTKFNSNTALVDGGAIFSSGDVKLNWCDFDSNSAVGAKVTKCYGGAIRAANIRVFGSSFISNYAENHGGAIYTDTFMTDVSNCTFKKNKAEEDGGAIYINNGNSLSFKQCLFAENHAGDEGGVIYLDSTSSKISLLNNIFIANSADDGQAVFNKGSYGDIKNNWWAGNNPSKDKNILVEWKFWTSNENHVDSDPLEVVLTFDKSRVKVGETVRATISILRSNGDLFTGDIPMDFTFLLPDAIKEISSGKTKNSAYIDLVAEKRGVFLLLCTSWDYLVAADYLIVTDADSSNGLADASSQILNSNCSNNAIENAYPVLKSIDNCSNNAIENAYPVLKSIENPQSGCDFNISAVLLSILSILGL